MKSLFFTLSLILFSTMNINAQTTKLPLPDKNGGMLLMQALSLRHSGRSFDSTKSIPENILSDMLWAACGVNRDDTQKRTAPSSMNYREIEIYIASVDGVFKYTPESHSILKISSNDIRIKTGTQNYVKDASVNLIYAADFSKTKNGKSEYQIRASYANTGFIAQNVYLYCASANLETVIRASFDEKNLLDELKLNSDTFSIILCQSVGYKK